MKKIIFFALAAVLFFALAACGDDKNTSGGKGSSEGDQPVITSPPETGSLEDEIRVTVPLSALDEDALVDLDAFVKANGFSSVSLNESDETVTITAKAFRYRNYLTTVGMDVISKITKLEKSKKYPYLVSVDEINKEDFSSATVTVKRDSFRDDLPNVIGQYLLLYKQFEGNGGSEVSVIVNDEGGNPIETFVYSGTSE